MSKIILIGLLFCCVPAVVLIAMAVKSYRESKKAEPVPVLNLKAMQDELDAEFGTPVRAAARMQ